MNEVSGADFLEGQRGDDPYFDREVCYADFCCMLGFLWILLYVWS